MVKTFFKSTWVFFVAAAAVIASTALLSFGIRAVHAAEMQNVSLIETPDTAIRQAESQQVAEDGDFALPDFLMTYGQTGYEPTAKDYSADEVIQIVVRVLTGVYGADLEGEVGRIEYYGSESSGIPGRGEWFVSFGSHAPGTTVYNVEVDSISGLVLYLSRSQAYAEGAEAVEGEMVQDYQLYVAECIREAETVATEHFALGRDILEISPVYDEVEPDGQGVRIRVLLEEGAILVFEYEAGSIQPERIAYTPSPDVLYSLEEPTAEAEPAMAAEAPAEIAENSAADAG